MDDPRVYMNVCKNKTTVRLMGTRFFASTQKRPGLSAALAGIFLFALPIGLPAQMIPDAPAQNVFLPMFGDDGYRIWDLRGREAHYVSAGQVDVIDMRLNVYAGGEEEQREMMIESPEALVFFDRNEARGEKGIVVSGDNYRAEGESWSWERRDNRIVIQRNVRVIFFEELEGFLMPLP